MEKIEPRTTTDLGKIMLTNGHEYNPETVYEKNTFVLYQNSTYLALQTVTGIEPSNDLVNWQLMAKGFAGDDFVAENFVFVNRGDDESDPAKEPLIDADALGGNKPDFYAPQHEISDAFSTEKDYAIGDYCIYLNSLYRFTTAKPAGAWDGAAVVPVTIAQEMQDFSTRIESINGKILNRDRKSFGTVSLSQSDDKHFIDLIPPNSNMTYLFATIAYWGNNSGVFSIGGGYNNHFYLIMDPGTSITELFVDFWYI